MLEINQMLHNEMRAQGKAAYKKFLCSELIFNWDKLVDKSISEKIKPVAIEHGVLLVDVKSSALKDQLKFLAEEIIETLNKNFEEPLVKKIKIAKSFQVAGTLPEKNSSEKIVEPEIKIEQITLTDEEQKICEEQAKKFSDEKLRSTFLEMLLTQAKVQKFRLIKGWHKCAKCNTLCPPEEIFCEVCALKEREAMVEELSKIFYDEPWIKTSAAQKKLLAKMPHMQRECSADAVESARTSLIQRVASHIRFGDEESPDVLKLVMLEKRLPPDKLTPVIIKRALSDLRFNLAELPKLPLKSFGN